MTEELKQPDHFLDWLKDRMHSELWEQIAIEEQKEMSVTGLVERVGSGMVNFIFFDNGKELKLVGWPTTNQMAWIWIERKLIDLSENVPWEEWPHKIVVVFVIFQSEVRIEISKVSQLVRTSREFPSEKGLIDTPVYKFREPTDEEYTRVTKQIIENWPTYQKLEGVI